jgi:hypothetical protein
VDATLGRVMTTAQLDALGLVAPVELEQTVEIVPLRPRRVSGLQPRERQLPDYERLPSWGPAVKKSRKGPDRSMADYF